MNRAQLSLLSGLAAFFAGAMWMIRTVMPWSWALAPALLLTLAALIGLQVRLMHITPWWSWVGFLVAASGLVVALTSFVLVVRGDAQNVNLLEGLALGGLGGLAAGLVLLDLASRRVSALPRLRRALLILGLLVGVYVAWLSLFILNRPYPPVAIIAVWMLLGMAVGGGWIFLGSALVSAARPRADDTLRECQASH